jgi:hypothetical protein
MNGSSVGQCGDRSGRVIDARYKRPNQTMKLTITAVRLNGIFLVTIFLRLRRCLRAGDGSLSFLVRSVSVRTS